MTLLPLLPPYVYRNNGFVYRIITCPWCGAKRLRAVSNEVLGLDDPRLGNAHQHTCCHYHIWKEMEQKIRGILTC